MFSSHCKNRVSTQRASFSVCVRYLADGLRLSYLQLRGDMQLVLGSFKDVQLGVD